MDTVILSVSESPQPYHVKALRLWQQLEQEGKVDRGKVYHSRIEHDDWCTIFKDRPRCSCDPGISFIPHEEPGCGYCRRYGGFPIGVTG